MATKIKVNGVSYDSVESMPPDVRRIYDETLTRFPELADRDGDNVPDLFQEGRLGPVQYTKTFTKKIMVNGKTYDGEAAMPPDVRRMYEEAMRAAHPDDPTVDKSEVHLSFQITGSRPFGFSKSWGSSSRQQKGVPAELISSTPIQPASGERQLRLFILVLGATVIGGVILWYLAGTP